jgi:DNA-binding MarR family transcriptional regulator
MSFEAMAWAIKQEVGNTTAKFVLLMVANYADEQGRAWPSQERLAEGIEASRHTVMRALDFLEEGGFMARERRHRADGSRAADVIRLDLSRNLLRSKNSEPMSQIATAEPITEPISKHSKKTRARGVRLPEDWTPTPDRMAKAAATIGQEALEEELAKFVNYWVSKAGRDAVKLDWGRTFDNWIINAKSRRPTNGREHQPTRDTTEARRRRQIYEAHLGTRSGQ